MKTETGTCRYCGQIRIVKVPGEIDFTQEELDKIASQECTCAGAVDVRNREYAIRRGCEVIDMMETTEEVADLLKRTCAAIGRGQIEKAQIRVNPQLVYVQERKSGWINTQRRFTRVIAMNGTEPEIDRAESHYHSETDGFDQDETETEEE